ncbi:MAG: N,N-dimethylformamidase beta subunit family domain-containing protein [Dermatophilaceae bacterium]
MRGERFLVWALLGLTTAAMMTGIAAFSSGSDAGATPKPSPGAAHSATAAVTGQLSPSGRVARPLELAGYAYPASSSASSRRVTLFVTATVGKWSVTAYRVTAAPNGDERLTMQWSSRVQPGVQQPTAVTVASTRTVTTRWRPSLVFDTTTWLAGFYRLRLTGTGRVHSDIAFVVESSTGANGTYAGQVVLMSSQITQAAYNTWGGRSLYRQVGIGPAARSYAVSLDRPVQAGILGPVRLEEPLVALAQSVRPALPLAYTTDLTLARHPGQLVGARALVVPGHSEYWPVSLRHGVQHARDAGMNLLVFGANTSYFRVRLQPSDLGPDRVIVSYKDATLDPLAGADPAQATVRYIDRPGRDPEDSLLGTLFRCSDVKGRFVVTSPEFFAYAGSGTHAGESYPGLIAFEVDRQHPHGFDGIVQVVAHSPVYCGVGASDTDMVYAVSPSGAGTIDVGTIGWVPALNSPYPTTRLFTRQVTRNLMVAAAAGPLGNRHPIPRSILSALLGLGLTVLVLGMTALVLRRSLRFRHLLTHPLLTHPLLTHPLLTRLPRRSDVPK